jgi:RNA polymerase sigma factor (sigma-70 family)
MYAQRQVIEDLPLGRKEGLSLNGYLAEERSYLFLTGLFSRLFSFLCSLLHINFAVIEDNCKRQESVSRAVINAQAERMLADYGNAVLRTAYSYLHNMTDAEEILQDTMVQFIKTAPALESKKHERAWLLRVACNLSKNRLKYNSIRQTDELTEALVSEEQEDLSYVWEAVKALPDKFRVVIHLFYHEGYQTAQIAKILDMKEATVRSNLARGRERLKNVLKEAYDFE